MVSSVYSGAGPRSRLRSSLPRADAVQNEPVSEERAPAAGFGLLLILLGGAHLALGVLLNEATLSFLYADGRLVRDLVARIRTVQAGFLSLGVLFGLSGLALRAWSPGRLSPRVWNLALAVVLLVDVPTSAELLLSLRYPGFYVAWDPFRLCRTSLAVDDTRLGHVLNPALDHSYRINSRGFRGPEVPDAKPSGEFRIVTVGDSITFGWELSEDEATYPGQLQSRLAGRRAPGGRAFRVVNAGVPRYTSEQVLRWLRERVLDLEPDLIVLCVGWNDLAFSYLRDWRPRISFTGHARARYCQGFSPAILRTIRHWKGEGDGDEAVAEDAARPPGRARRPDPAALADYRANLDEIAALLEQRGVGLLVLNLPSVLSRGPMSAAERRLASRFPEVENLELFEGVLGEFCAEVGASCVRDVFPLDQAGKGEYFYDHCHPNAAGNGILARKVAEALERDPRLLVRSVPAALARQLESP
jgi:lysophospholipase L1-like esterase